MMMKGAGRLDRGQLGDLHQLQTRKAGTCSRLHFVGMWERTLLAAANASNL